MSNVKTKSKRVVFKEGTWSPALRRVTGDGYERPAMKVSPFARRLLDVIMARSRGWTHKVRLSNSDAKRLGRLSERYLREARKQLHEDGLLKVEKADTRGETYSYTILEAPPGETGLT